MNDASGADMLKAARAARKKMRRANHLNLGHELTSNLDTIGLVVFDEFSRQVILRRPIPQPGRQAPEQFTLRPWTDDDTSALAEHFNSVGFGRCGTALVYSVVHLEASRHPFHAVRDYLNGLPPWDGTKRLSTFLFDCCGAVLPDDDGEQKAARGYIEAVTRAFFISAVARIYQPGCQVDTMLILEGEQGVMKSRLLRALAKRDEWFTDSLPHDLESKDARAHLAGVWIVEMAEIAQFRRADVESVKRYLSCRIDKYRPAYGRCDVQAPRSCVFAGSTNAETYLHDPTGNRRFWPVRVRVIQLDKARGMVDQLWAEAVVAYRAGEKWWLEGEHEKRAAIEQEARVARDPWEETVADFVAIKGKDEFTTADVLAHLAVPQERRDRAHETRIGNILRDLKCIRRRLSSGTRPYVYRCDNARK